MAPSNNRIYGLGDYSGSSISRKTGNGDGRRKAEADSNPLAAPFCQPTSASNGDSKGGSIPLLCHIPNLPSHEECKSMLQRIHAEFEPIVRQRGYRVLSVSEMCCCADGLDSVPTANGRKRRQRRKQPNNVLGYNMTQFRGPRTTHAIHLRLRNPRNHNRLFEYEDVAGTMAHELAHCVHQNHGPEFYKLMEEIMEQHATQMAQTHGFFGSGGFFGGGQVGGSSAAAQTMPSSGGNRLGGGTDIGMKNLHPNNPRNGIGGVGGGRRLGGSDIPKHLLRDAMVQAAENRKRQMERVRRAIEKATKPCVIELLSDDEEDDERDGWGGPPPIAAKRPRLAGKRRADAMENRSDGAANFRDESKMKAKDEHEIIIFDDAKLPALQGSGITPIDLIDLTSPKMEGTATDPAISGASGAKWACQRCTFLNLPLSLMCGVCHSVKGG